ncbi:F5/8 type C domain containing protein [Histomonas meleagridis]|uniref:F5/8 type C domain containing protein n=1 Tax=Histomonas meleagridis TaxID=135588 RepID=UPI0035596883|nr:F5/8 type C domain containing protein [Histomonas meleagridis]KAH0797177.1 F5/8 type C domain containing protein [Histomonas meleagridis]
MQAISQFGQLKDIQTFRYIYENRVYSIPFVFINFSETDTYNKLLHSDQSQFQFAIINEFEKGYSSKSIAIILGLPKPDDPKIYNDMFSSYGAQDIQYIEKVNNWDEGALLLQFESNIACKRFCQAIDGTSINGHKLCSFPFSPTLSNTYISRSFTLPPHTPQDFTLLYYDKEYPIWLGSAISLSTQIFESYSTDPTITKYVVPQIPGPFELVVTFFRGNSIQLNSKNVPFIFAISESLGITELLQLTNRFLTDCTDIEAEAEMLPELYSLGLDYTKQLSTVANSFDKLRNNIYVNRYSSELLSMIFSSPYFSITDENDLLTYIQTFQDNSPQKYLTLLKQIRIERLNTTNLKKFISDSTIDLNEYRSSFLQLSHQLEFKQQTETPSTTTTKIDSSIPKQLKSTSGNLNSLASIFSANLFEYDNNAEHMFKGIFAHLYLVVGRNPVLANVIRMTASSTSHSTLSVLIDPHTNDWFGTQDSRDSYIRINFMDYRVSLTGYSLKTHTHEGNGHLTGWTIRGTNNPSGAWTELHRVPNTNQFNRLGAVGYFRISQNTQYYQHFEIKQIRQNTMGYYNLRLSKIEFFGSLMGRN